MNVIGFSGLANSIPFKRKHFPGLSEREYNIAQGLDAAATLVNSAGIVAAAAEERFTRQKATGAFPVNAIHYCLQEAKLDPKDVDFIGHGFNYEQHRTQFATDEIGRLQYEEVYSPEVQRELLRQHFPGADWDKKLVPVSHHLAHAASAFYPSGFEEALILVSDGMGETESLTVAVGRGADIQTLTQVSAFHSLGAFYGVMTLYLGFFMNSDEYKVMGLAPYGNPKRYFEKLMGFVTLKEDGTYTLPIFARNQTAEERETHRGVLRYLIEQFGPTRDPESEITQQHKDLAAGLQAVVQTCQLHVLRHFKRETGLKNLCMAGGVALNCSANGVIKRSELFKRVFVQPAAGDDGTALGAALYVQRLNDQSFKPTRMSVPLWGPEFSEEDIRQELNGRTDCEVVEVDSFGEVCEEVATRIARGEIVAWHQGRMEFGPRALGSRSILADPRDPTMRDRINALVKKREGFRPFAPVVTRERAAEVFDIPPGDEATFAHMLYVTHVRPAFRDKLPATTHVDGSARAQTVAFDENPNLYQLLKAFEAKTGVPVLLNTSFNVRGQPIVCTVREAVDTFIKANLDLLVVGHFLVVPRKKETEAEDAPDTRDLEEAAARHEEFWVNRLASLEPISAAVKRQELAGERSEKQVVIPLPAELTSKALNGEPFEEVLTAAFAVSLARTAGLTNFDLAFTDCRLEHAGRANLSSLVPMHLELEMAKPFSLATEVVREECARLRDRGTFKLNVFPEHPSLRNGATSTSGLVLPVGISFNGSPDEPKGLSGCEITLVINPTTKTCALVYDGSVIDAESASSLAKQIVSTLQSAISHPEKSISELCLLNAQEIEQVLVTWNDTRRADVPTACVHDLFRAQARKTPDKTALVFQEQSLTYAELDRRSDIVAAHLRELGIGPDKMVAVCAEVSLEMMIGLLGVLKAGGAYVPLDPKYPADRISFMLQDSEAPVVLTQKHLLESLPATSAHVLCVDSISFDPAANGNCQPFAAEPQDPQTLAYVIYTSGSTGKPKGVMVQHSNVVNFFTGMDESVGPDPDGVWLAVTSISFDISVLELFWTLVRGLKVVLQPRQNDRRASATKSERALDFSLFYFASDESTAGTHKYRLLLEGAKFADQNGFAAVWTPERHFHAFGGLYPNPSVTSAAVAAVTHNVQIRAGSVVLPLHNPVRVAEEWSVVDNISNGRVAISFASGWQVNDFALAPHVYKNRKETMMAQLEEVRRLWRGEPFTFTTPKGENVPLRTLPRPVQTELPIWLTASGNPETFRLAGEAGASVLTHLLGQSPQELADKIRVYRDAWKAAGHTGEGHVTLMLHTFVGESMESVRETVRKPFTNYLRSSIDLIKNDPWAFSTFKPAANGKGDSGSAHWSDEERDAMAKHAFNRYFETSGLFGTPAHCAGLVQKFQELGVDELACLIDFGVPDDQVLDSLKLLNEVRKQSERSAEPVSEDYSPAAQMERHGVTHMQCTPSMMSMLLEEPHAVAHVRRLKKLLLGGEAVPLALVQQIDVAGDILNMYGPTETTIWSCVDRINKSENQVTIGKPIANTTVYIVDKYGQPAPAGVPGELLIGGAGVVRGYLHQPELTAEKFIPDTFGNTDGARLYRTGDLARHLPDGRIEFLGRLDHQVKLRGFRIELGEIEAVLRRHDAVKECVAIVREDKPGDKRLVAYLVPNAGQRVETNALREYCKSLLPEFMVPSAFVPMKSLPLTPNGKTDRKALPKPSQQAQRSHNDADPESLTEQKIAEVYRELLGVEFVSVEEDFFALGGNSLLATQLITRLREAFRWELPLRLAFEHPTVRALANAIATETNRREVVAPTGTEVETAATTHELPLSFAQQRIWFLHQLEPGSHYNDHFDLRLTGPVNPEVLERAINEVVRRHEALRSTFLKGDSGGVLNILPFAHIPLPATSLEHLPASERESAAIKLSVEDCQKSFDLETGPLMRASLVRLAPQDHLLILTFDHIVIDGWSHASFFRN